MEFDFKSERPTIPGLSSVLKSFPLGKITFSRSDTLSIWIVFRSPPFSPKLLRTYEIPVRSLLLLLSLQEENPGISLTDQSKKAGEIWREMGESDKKEWEKKTKEAKEAYDIEYKEWLESGGAEAIKQVLFTSLASDHMRGR